MTQCQFNQENEERLLANWAEKQNTTSRRRLSHQTKPVKERNYAYPLTYNKFLEEQRNAYTEGILEGQQIFQELCPEAAKFKKKKKGQSN